MDTTRKQLQSFAAIGAIGFLADGGILTVLNSGFDVGLLQARCVSFAVAVTVTWILNRRRTFAAYAESRMAREWARYALVNGIGALLNVGIFLWLVYKYTWLAAWPLVPLAFAAFIAMLFNFYASRHVAFQRRAS